MINKIVDGMVQALNAEFGTEYEVYTEDVEQGLQEPCFLIKCVTPSIQQKLDRRYRLNNVFCVHYFPISEDEQTECLDVQMRLYGSLELIEHDGSLIRGTQIHSEISDGVLHFFVNYDFFAMKPKEETAMETLEVDQNVKG